MSDHYIFKVIDRTSTNDGHYVSAEQWEDDKGHPTHIAVVFGEYGVEEMTLVIASAEEARRLKNLFAKVERRMT